MRLYIIRHADPDYINDTITPKGHLEAQALARRLKSHGLDKIYCSPMGRAIKTMQYTAETLGMDYEIEEWMQEIHGLWLEDSPWGEMSAWDIPGETVRGEDTMPTHSDWMEHEILKGTKVLEIFEEIKRCSDDFLKRQGFERVGGRYKILRENRDKIAVFCHCGLALTWLAHLLEIPVSLMWTGFWMAPSSVTIVLFEERSDQWAVPRCLQLGDISHLYHERIPERPRSNIKSYY